MFHRLKFSLSYEEGKNFQKEEETEMKKVNFTLCVVHLFALSVCVSIATPPSEETVVAAVQPTKADVVALISMNQLLIANNNSNSNSNTDECVSCSDRASIPASVSGSPLKDFIVNSHHVDEEANKRQKRLTREKRVRRDVEKGEKEEEEAAATSDERQSVASLESSNSTEYHKFAVVTDTIDLTSDSMSIASSDELTHAESTSRSSEKEETEAKRDAPPARVQRTNTTNSTVTTTLVNNVTEATFSSWFFSSSSTSPSPWSVSRDLTTTTVINASGHSDDASEKDETKFLEEPVDFNISSHVRKYNGQYQLYNRAQQIKCSAHKDKKKRERETATIQCLGSNGPHISLAQPFHQCTLLATLHLTASEEKNRHTKARESCRGEREKKKKE